MTTPDSTVSLVEAMAASQRGDTAEAIAQLQRAARLPGAGGVPLLLLAAQWASLGRMQEAEAAFAEALLRSPDLLVARFQLGLLQAVSGRHVLGQLTWAPLLELPADHPLRHYALGFLALVNDRFDEARASFERGLSLPQDNEALMNDIRKTLLAFSGSSSNAPQEVGAAPPVADDHHVLLAGYSAGHRRH